MDRLEREYGPDHTVIHYIAAMLPHQDPVTDKFTIAQLREPQIAKQVGGVSTFYIPPKERKVANMDIVQELEFLPKGVVPNKVTDVYPANQWEPERRPTMTPYGPSSMAAIAQLETHIVPEQYQPLATTKVMTDVMTQLALDPKALAKYKADQSAFAQSVPGLSAQERTALESGNSWALRCAMRNVPVSMLEINKNPSNTSSASDPVPFFIVTGIIGGFGSVMAAGDFDAE